MAAAFLQDLGTVTVSSPIFVTGFKRSGTTLLGSIIDRHPRIAIFVESFFIPQYHYGQVAFWPLSNEANRLKLARAIATEPSARANRLTLDESVIRDLPRGELQDIIDAMMTSWAQGRGKARWGDKSPGYITKMPVLSRMFPDARFVHIIRDGRDVWLSVRRLGWDWDVTEVACDWRSSVSKARRFGSAISDRYLEVRYEDLLRRPEETLRQITAFVGEDYDPRMLQPSADGPANPALSSWPGVNEPIDASNFGKWRTRLGEEETAIFELLAGDLLERLGYGLSPHSLGPRRRIRTQMLSFAHRFGRARRILSRGTRVFTRAIRGRVGWGDSVE